MQREKAKAILLRIAETLTRGPFMAVPRKLFVFGSFARGALEPEDLDLLLLYDYPKDHRERLKATKRGTISEMLRDHPEAHYAAEFRKRLRKPGEKMDLLVHHPRHDFVVSLFEGRQSIKPDDLRLVWRKGDKTAWRGRIEGIRPDPEAGRMVRSHFFPVKRLAEGLPFMEAVMAMIEQRLLRFRLLPLESVPVKLNKDHRYFIDWATRSYGGRPIAGRETARLLPYLCGWGDMHGQAIRFLRHNLEAWNDAFDHRAHLGRPSLRSMVYAFVDREGLKRQALIPHIKKGEVNGILEFERGERWNPELAVKMDEAANQMAMPTLAFKPLS